MMRDLDDLEDVAAELLMGRASGWDEALETAPETKAVAEEGRDLAGLLSEIMTELREELVMFRAMRARAQAAMETEGEDHKTAKADAKAASEAIQQIVRTLEKLDSLQRTLAEERAAREEATFDAEAHQALAARVERLIEARARELAEEMRARREPDEARDGPEESGAADDLYGSGMSDGATEADGATAALSHGQTAFAAASPGAARVA